MGLLVWVFVKSGSFATFLELTGFDQDFWIAFILTSISSLLKLKTKKNILSTNQMLNGINHVVSNEKCLACKHGQSFRLFSLYAVLP